MIKHSFARNVPAGLAVNRKQETAKWRNTHLRLFNCCGVPQQELELCSAFGFDPDDKKHLEHLSDLAILHSLPKEKQNLVRHVKADVIEYLRAWALPPESKLLEEVSLSLLETAPQEVGKEYNLLAYLPD